MSIEQIIRISVAGIILGVMLIMMGEIQTLRWMLMVIGLSVVATCIKEIMQKNKKPDKD
ncbi:MAG: hypothetical protein U0L26_01195 [Cellulosilyticum sp.]|nr:hypothetical protein [Cellulosilyticum sp.]